MLYHQMKYWLTRKIHLFETDEETGEEYSLCGCAIACGCYYVQPVEKTFVKQFQYYDDLNYCQSCLKIALKGTKDKYSPLCKMYVNPITFREIAKISNERETT